MTRTKKKERLEQEFESFADIFAAPGPLAATESVAVAGQIAGTTIADFGNGLLSFLKAAFLYFPGAVLLFLTSSFFFEAFFVDKVDSLSLLANSWWLGLYAFMMILGGGNIRRLKSLAIPFSVIAISFATFLLSIPLGGIFGRAAVIDLTFYLLPAVLATPYLISLHLEKRENH